MPRGNPDKLIPGNKRSHEEASENGRKGGIQSGKKRREKKLMSQIYAEFLAKEHNIMTSDGKKKPVSGSEMVSSVMRKVLSRGDSASVSLMREVREGTEGSKIKTETVLTINTDDEKIQAILKEHGVNKPESEN